MKAYTYSSDARRQLFIITFLISCLFAGSTQITHACTTTVERGDSGPAVTCVQQMLQLTNDYTYGEITGYFGPATEDAIRSFQASQGIVSAGTPETTGYGIAGPETRRSLLATAITTLLSKVQSTLARVAGIETDAPSSDAAVDDTIHIGSERVVAETKDIPCVNGADSCVDSGRRLDATYPTIIQGTKRYWFVVNSDHTTKLEGTLDAPFTKKVWSKSTQDIFGEVKPTSDDVIRDKKWVMNTWQTTDGDILGFVHIERETGYPGVVGKGRVGLAWSTDYGKTFKFLGYIAIPYKDPNMNISGMPYVINNGYFYVYYNDLCPGGSAMAVIRAKVDDVLEAARNGTVTPWHKYKDGSWDSLGLGGACTGLIPSLEGGAHSDATYSTYSNKYYLLVHRPINEQFGFDTSFVKIYSSKNGVDWAPEATVSEKNDTQVQFGYAYPEFVSTSPTLRDNNRVGKEFYVYATEDAAAGQKILSDGKVVRWKITLGEPDLYSSNYFNSYSSTQGKNDWYYEYGKDELMTWNASADRWEGGGLYPQIRGTRIVPSAYSPASLVWKAPTGGDIELTGEIKDLNGKCGNGVYAIIRQNGTQKWMDTIENGETSGHTHDISLSVSAGDEIAFQVYPRNNDYSCDATSWNPTVTYTSSDGVTAPAPPAPPIQPAYSTTFLEGFATTQGANDWYYEYGAHTPMTWNVSTDRWEGDEQFLQIAKAAIHPSANAPAIMSWKAPKDGTVDVVGTILDVNKKCGNGIIARISKNDDRKWLQIIPNGGQAQHDITVPVVGGDRLNFTVFPYNQDNACDSTSWNPSITYTK